MQIRTAFMIVCDTSTVLNMDVINYTVCAQYAKRSEQRLQMFAKYDTTQRRFNV